MDNSRPHLTGDSAIVDGKMKMRRKRDEVGNGVGYGIAFDADEEWDFDEEEELKANLYPIHSRAESGLREQVLQERGRTKLRDARLDEPRTTDFTMTKFDGFSRRMEGMRGVWVEEARVNTISPPNTRKGNKKKDKRDGKVGLFGTPIHDYPTYHASTIALLKPDADALNSLYHTYKIKRQALGRSISEKSSMVHLKAGNTLEGMVEEMITPGPEEIGEQAYREAEADRRIEKEEERKWDTEIERGRVRVGVEGWGGRNWGRRGSA